MFREILAVTSIAFSLSAYEIPRELSENYSPDLRWETIEKYVSPNQIFIETATKDGSALCAALSAGSKELYSIESNLSSYREIRKQFSFDLRVRLFLGDARNVLKHLLSSISERAVFWLDTHPDNSACFSLENNPILEELALIGTHPIKNHTILIDKITRFKGTLPNEISIPQIIQAIRTINPDYEFAFEDGLIKNDVLVARSPEAY